MCTFCHKILFCKVVITRKIQGKTSESQRGKNPNQPTPGLVETRRFPIYCVMAQKVNAMWASETLIWFATRFTQNIVHPNNCLLFLPFPKSKSQWVEINFFSSCSANKISNLTALLKLVLLPILLVQKLSTNLQRCSQHFYLFSDNQPLTFTLSWYYLFVPREIYPKIKPEISL